MEAAVETCNFSNIDLYVPNSSNPWDAQKINHLYRRAAFGLQASNISAALQKSPSLVVDELIEEALNAPPTEAPIWGFWYMDEITANDLSNSALNQEWRSQMIDDCLNNNLRERLTLFWSNHFVTQYTDYIPGANTYQYYNVLQRHAIGNFRDFVAEIGLSTAMLQYLNGNENSMDNPNENYARELYELFTLGFDNGYTQDDITETARALTGYTDEPERWGPLFFDPDDFDDDNKTIFAQEGNWGYDDVIRILFETHSDRIAVFICGKLYQYFVDKEINESIVNELATTFLANDFEIAPVLSQLFKSKHFFDEATFGVVIKSPMDLLITFLKEAELEYDNVSFPILIRIRNATEALGQSIFNPIDVAGWQGGRSWIGSNTLINRWDTLNTFLRQAQVSNDSVFQNLAINIMNGDSSINDPSLVSKSIVDYFLPRKIDINATENTEALEIFKGDIPSNYFEDGIWNLSWDTVPEQVNDLLKHILTLPQFQLK